MGDSERHTAAEPMLVAQLCTDLAAWAAPHPVLDPVRFPAVALTIAAHLPDLRREDRALAALVALWLATFDDLVDEERLQGAELDASVAWYKAIVSGALHQAEDRDQEAWGVPADAIARKPEVGLGRLLSAIVRCLGRYGTFAALAPHWRSSFERMVDAIVHQRELGLGYQRATSSWVPRSAEEPALILSSGLSSQQGWPTLAAGSCIGYEALLDLVQESIGVRHYLATCFIIYDDPAIVTRLAVLQHIAIACARAIRLANDLRTWDREERERTINLVVLERAAVERANPELSPAACQQRALRALEERLVAQLAATQALLAASPAADDPLELSMGRFVRFVAGFYAVRDYHAGVPQ